MSAFGAVLLGLSPNPSAATSPPPPFDPVVRGPLLGEPAHAEMIGDPDRTGFPGNPALLAPIALFDPMGTEVLLEPHPSLPEAWRPAVPLVAGTYTSTSGTLESTGLVDDVPPATPSIVSIEPVVYSSSGGCSRNEPAEYLEGVVIEFDAISDDATPRERMTLAIYAGHSASEVESASNPVLVAIEGSRWFEYDITATGYAHFAVEAVDLAGNVSPRSSSYEYIPEE